MATAARCRRPRSCAGDWPPRWQRQQRRRRHRGWKAPRRERTGPAWCAAPPSVLLSAPGCAAAQVPRPALLLLLLPRRALRISPGEKERDVLALRPPPPSAFCWLCVCFVVFFFFSPNLFFLILIFRPLFLALFRSGGFAGDKNSSAPPGEAGALPMRLPGTGGADSRSGFIDSRLVPSSPKQPGLVSVRIANCGEQ